MLLKDEFYFMPKSKIKAGEGKDEGLYPFFTSSDIKVKRIDNYLFNDELVVLGTGGMPSCNYYNGKFAVSTDIFVLKSKGRIKPKYLYYFLRHNNLSILAAGFRGTGLKHISKEYTNEIDIPYKEPNIQKELIDIADVINILIDNCKKDLHLYDEMVKSRFNEMFSKDIETVKIGDVLKTTSGGTPSKGRLEYYSNGNIPWLCSGEVNAGIITEVKNKITELGLKNSSAKWIPENSVVVAMYGATAGKVGLLKIKTTTNQAVCSILPDSKFMPEFLYYAVGSKTEELVSKAWGGAQPNISQGIIKNTYIPFPSLDKQNEFASFVESVDKLKFNVQQRINIYQELLNKKMDEY
ncbi:MAG: hypothetical protein E7338_07090, partial [Clostridiales bacterium]|nr:hypothetical protein [Clostridiales bacterium]